MPTPEAPFGVLILEIAAQLLVHGPHEQIRHGDFLHFAVLNNPLFAININPQANALHPPGRAAMYVPGHLGRVYLSG